MDEIICASHNQTHTHHTHTVDFSWLISVEFKNGSCFDFGRCWHLEQRVLSTQYCTHKNVIACCHPSTTQGTHTYWHGARNGRFPTLSIRLLWIKLNCNYDKLSSIMPCHPFCPAKSDVICFKLGNGYPFDFILSCFLPLSASLSLWLFLTQKHAQSRTHTNESHQLVSMNIAIWITVSSQRNATTIFYFSAGVCAQRNSKWLHWYFGNRIKCYARAHSQNTKWVHESVHIHWVFVSTICKWTKSHTNRMCVRTTTENRAACMHAHAQHTTNAIRSSRCHHHHNIFNIIPETWQSNTNCVCYAHPKMLGTQDVIRCISVQHFHAKTQNWIEAN